jgi:hypothetical protein
MKTLVKKKSRKNKRKNEKQLIFQENLKTTFKIAQTPHPTKCGERGIPNKEETTSK